LTNTVLTAPAVPASITITPLLTNVCNKRIYRYTAPTLPVATATATAATGWLWSIEGILNEYATIDTGSTGSDSAGTRYIVVSYTSNDASAAGDSIRLTYLSACGNSVSKAAKLTNTKLSAPAVPASITVTPLLTNVCGSRKYRYTVPITPAATTTTGAATGYVWDFRGTLKDSMTVDTGTLTDQSFTVTFASNSAAVGSDSIGVFYTSAGCGNSVRKGAKLTNTKLSAPAVPASITITPLQTNVCGARKYRYTAPNKPFATTTTGAATGYVWDFRGTLKDSMTVDTGTITDQSFTVTFASNSAAVGSDSIGVLYTSAGCGNSVRKGAKLTNTKLSAPAAPASVTIQQVLPDVCGARIYRYIAADSLGATTTAGAATGYLWSSPTGTVGSTGVFDSGRIDASSGRVTGKVVRYRYSSNSAAGSDSIRVLYTSGCGDGAIKAQKLSNLVKTGCPLIAKTTPISRVPNTLPTSMEVKVYPNPTTSQFNVQVKSTGTEEAVVRVLDVTGRFIKSVKLSSNSNVNLGADLKAGAYMLEVKQGKEVKTVRVMKF